MQHLLYEPTAGGECNVCGMGLNLLHLNFFEIIMLYLMLISSNENYTKSRQK